MSALDRRKRRTRGNDRGKSGSLPRALWEPHYNSCYCILSKALRGVNCHTCLDLSCFVNGPREPVAEGSQEPIGERFVRYCHGEDPPSKRPVAALGAGPKIPIPGPDRRAPEAWDSFRHTRKHRQPAPWEMLAQVSCELAGLRGQKSPRIFWVATVAEAGDAANLARGNLDTQVQIRRLTKGGKPRRGFIREGEVRGEASRQDTSV